MSSEKAEGGDLVRTQPVKLQRNWNLLPGSFGEAMEIAGVIARSEFAPKSYIGKPESVMLAIQMGADLGLSPMQSLQNIAVINNRPCLWGDGALALVMPALERLHETFEGEPNTDAYTAVCTAKRKGWPDETVRKFSIADAKKAGLWGKAGPWQNYPGRMLQMRARGFTLRDVAADRLMGLVLAEEAMDTPSIEGTVVASEMVDPPVRAIMAKLEDVVIENLDKAFNALNFNPAQKLVKCNEFFMADGVTPEDAATNLLEWCRDEFARRKTGQPRVKSDNNKPSRKAEAPQVDRVQPPAGVRADPSPASDGAGGDRVPGVGAGSAPALTADEVFTPAKAEGELF